MNKSTGRLILVATPIGNLGDVSARAIETLKSAHLIACEDTRQTAKLLQRYAIRAPLGSLHDHNERQRTPEILRRLAAGETVALVSDSGTPLISDPGWWLVHCAIEQGIDVTWVPGPVACVGALVLSGLPIDRFVFEGFLPPKPGARRQRLRALKHEERTVVLYESPHRLVRTLTDIHQVLGDVRIACARELTKLFEEVYRGLVSQAIERFTQRPAKGELVLVLHR